MIEYNKAVQWLHDNPLTHRRVKLRSGETAVALHTLLERKRPILIQREEAGAEWRRPNGRLYIGTLCDFDIVGFADPEPQVYWRRPDGEVLFTQEMLEKVSEEERAPYTERVLVTPAPLEEKSDG